MPRRARAAGCEAARGEAPSITSLRATCPRLCGCSGLRSRSRTLRAPSRPIASGSSPTKLETLPSRSTKTSSLSFRARCSDPFSERARDGRASAIANEPDQPFSRQLAGLVRLSQARSRSMNEQMTSFAGDTAVPFGRQLGNTISFLTPSTVRTDENVFTWKKNRLRC